MLTLDFCHFTQAGWFTVVGLPENSQSVVDSCEFVAEIFHLNLGHEHEV